MTRHPLHLHMEKSISARRSRPAPARQPASENGALAAQHGLAPGDPYGFPVFDELQKRRFEASPHPMRIVEHGTMKYLAVNDAALKLYGYTREEFLKLMLRDTRHPSEHAEQAATFDLDTGCFRHSGPRRHVRRSGEVIFVEVTTQDILFDGRPARLSLTIDITGRKRAEAALSESNEFLRSMIESSRDCIKVLDLEGRMLSISTGGQRLMEVDDASALVGKSYLEFWDGEQRETAEKVLRIARGGDMGRFEGYCPTARGLPKWWDEIVTPMLDRHGRPERLLVVSRDITEQKKAEIALRESEERFRQLAENIRQVFWITTLDGEKVIYVSPAYEEIWGRTRESLYGDPTSWMRAIHPDDLPRVKEAGDEIARGRPLDAEYRIIRPDGSLRWIRDRSYQMRSGDGTVLACGIAEDITDRKNAEQDRLAQAIRQRDALVREVHHRIKNSLQGVAGLLRQKIRKYPAIAPEIEEALGQLQSVALVYGLQGARSDGLLSLAEIMDAVCTSAESLIGGRVDRTVEHRSRRPVCVAGAEAVSVAVALNELVFNALKHQPAKAGKKYARLTLSESRDAAEIRISNSGSLPKGFDFMGGCAIGNGLGLVRTLLGSPGGSIAFKDGQNEVEVVLRLSPPLLAERQRAPAR